MTATFGRLDGDSLDLSDGLNILQAPNETGKSTWCAFLSAMLYGINSRERDRADAMADKNRFAPWSGKPMEGRLDCRTDSGDELSLFRQSRRTPMADFQAVYAGTGETVPGLTGDRCGETLLGVPKEVFERSAFIRQSGLSVTQDAELERRIVSLVTSGDEDTSYTEAAAALKKQLNRRRHNRTGEIPALEAELAEVRRQLSDAAAQHQALSDAQTQLETLRAQESELQRRMALCARRESAQKQETLQNAKTAAESARRRAADLQTQLAGVPENETIGRLRGAIVNLETVRKNVDKARAARDDARRTQFRAEQAADASPFTPMSAEDARREAAAPVKAPGKLLKLLPLLYLLLVVGFLGLNRAVLHLSYFIQAVAVLLPGIAVFAAVFSAKRRAAQENAARLKRFGVASAAELPALVEEYAALLAARETARTDAAGKSAAADSLYNSLSSNEQAILLEVRRFAPTAFDIPTADALLRECAQRRREAAEAQSAAQEAQARYEALAQQIPAADADFETVSTEEPAYDAGETAAALSALQDRLREVSQTVDRLSGAAATMGDPAVLTAQAEQLENRLSALNGEYDALALALDALDSANSALQSRFSPALGKRAAALFSELTDNRYTGVVLDRTLHLSAEPKGDTVYRDAQFLSAGALDQLYLAVRLAVCEMVLPDDRAVPIVLDDALAEFDNSRCAAALHLLRREAEHRQILLFTCHSREADFFKNDPQVRIQTLTNAPAQV